MCAAPVRCVCLGTVQSKSPFCALSCPTLQHLAACLENSLPECIAGHTSPCSALPIAPKLLSRLGTPPDLSCCIWRHTAPVKQRIDPLLPVPICQVGISPQPTTRAAASPLTCELCPAAGTERWSLSRYKKMTPASFFTGSDWNDQSAAS